MEEIELPQDADGKAQEDWRELVASTRLLLARVDDLSARLARVEDHLSRQGRTPRPRPPKPAG